MTRRLEGKVIIVTGAASGIGRASAILFAKEGAKVVVADIDEKQGRRTVETIQAEGGAATFVKCDVTNVGDAQNLAKATVNAYGKVDGLFNNAGINPIGTVVDTPVEVYDKVMDINLKGMFLVSKFVVPEMRKNKSGGAIVNTSSGDFILAWFKEAAYIATKGGVVGLTKAMAVDHAKEGIRVNAVLPGTVKTPLTEKAVQDMGGNKEDVLKYMIDRHPMGRLGEPEEIAKVVLFLLSDDASFVTGCMMTVDGGYTLTHETNV